MTVRRAGGALRDLCRRHGVAVVAPFVARAAWRMARTALTATV